jgi:hypothetical protein
MTDSAFGRNFRCQYENSSYPLWPSHTYCLTRSYDYSAKFESEKHTFVGTPTQKSETTAFWIHRSVQVDFVPVDIFSQFPNLNGLGINKCNLPILKSSLFKPEFQKIQYLSLKSNRIQSIEPNAFQYLNKLKLN